MSVPIIGVLETNSKYVFGMTKHNVPLYLFRPFDPTLSEMVVGSRERNLLQNHIALVDGPGVPKINDPALNFQLIRGNLNRILGPCGDKKTEVEALLWQYCPVYQKSNQKNFNKELFIPQESDKRVDLTGWFTLNIDPEGCVDIDDCLSYSYDNGKHYFAISISDVASQIDFTALYAKTAYEIGQSFYSNDKVRSMFPKEIERELSLFPGETRPCVSLIFEWSFEKGEIINPKFQETLLVNKLSLSYENVMKYVENENVSKIREFLMQISGVNDSHTWIEKLMIMYNVEAAKLLQKHKVGVFRKQKQSSLYDNDSYLVNCCPFLAIEAAEYCGYSEDLKHSILKVDAYTQVTSPIRRYVDLVNQRILKLILQSLTTNNLHILENIQIQLAGFRTIDESAHFNQINRKNKQHDRDLFFLNILMGPKVELNGFVLNIDSSLNELAKIRVYIPQWKRVINIKNIPFSDLVSDITPSNVTMKENIKLDYFYDPTKSGWKHRMVFKIY